MVRNAWHEDDGLLRPLVLDGVWSKVMEAMTSGVVLAGLALYLGASPILIGIVAASPFFAQFAQFAGLRLVFLTRERRRVSLGSALASRLLLGCVGFVALAGPSPWSLPLLLALLAASGSLSAVSALSWAFWMRDLIPQHIYGDRFSRRFAAQAAVSVLVTLLAGGALASAARAEAAGLGFGLLFFGGAAFGIIGLLYAARLPEVGLNPADAAPSPMGLVRSVWVEPGRRAVLLFVIAWTCAAFLGLPFVTVFLLQDVGLGFAVVSGLTALAMLASVVTFRFWGRCADRFGARAVLAVAIPSAAASTILLPAASSDASWRLIFLGGVFLTSGAAFAAVDVAVAKIIARHAPFTGAGTFLAGTGILRALAAGMATVGGGLAASILADRELRVLIEWGGSAGDLTVSGYAFLFAGSALLMLFAWHRVLGLRNEGAGDARDILHEAQVELAGLAPFRGVRFVGQFAGHVASHVLERRRRVFAPHGATTGFAPAAPSVRTRTSR